MPQYQLLVPRKRNARLGTAASTSGDRSAMNAVGSKIMARVGSFVEDPVTSWLISPATVRWPPTGLIAPPSLQYG